MRNSPAVVRAFNRSVARAQQRGMRAPRGPARRMLLSVIFRAMPGQLDRKRAQGVDAVVEWRVLNHRGVPDVWTAVIADGRCRVRRGPSEDPRATIELSTGDFLALASGNANGPALLFAGRLKLGGDMMFAAGLPALFAPPPPPA